MPEPGRDLPRSSTLAPPRQTCASDNCRRRVQNFGLVLQVRLWTGCRCATWETEFASREHNPRWRRRNYLSLGNGVEVDSKRNGPIVLETSFPGKLSV